MKVMASIQDLRGQLALWRQSGQKIALVPTMGNLHQGHLHLVEEAQKQSDRVVVSIFVNPTQFGPGEDFVSYPRTQAQDQRLLTGMGVDLLFLPEVSEIYPEPSRTMIHVQPLSGLHCGKSRPGHFAGVATVVCKLFNIIQPDWALFGKKDYQQLTVIQCMVRDLNIPVLVQAVATVRESDGLAMSSRNAYLTRQERLQAPRLYQCLLAAKAMILAGCDDFSGIERQQMQALRQAGFEPDYFTVCHADDLQPATDKKHALVILAAAKLGKARLIDNIELPPVTR